MPDRIVRAGILTSDAVNQLSWAAEVFYRRLHSVVDDYGRYDGRPEILRATLYPLKIDRVSKRDIETWLRDCAALDLVTLYTNQGKAYLEVCKFDQRLRTKYSRWPSPPSSADLSQQVAADGGEVPPNAADGGGWRPESEVETETEKITTLSGKPDADHSTNGKTPSHRSEAIEVLQFLNEKTGRKFRESDTNLKLIVARLKSGASVQDCKTVIARKHRQWAKDDKMWPYLRPATLFNATKFENYLGECVPPEEEKRRVE